MLRSGDSQLLAACRWALFAEKAVGMLDQAEQAAAADATHVTGRAKADVLRAKVAGAELRDLIRPLLFPEDGDG